MQRFLGILVLIVIYVLLFLPAIIACVKGNYGWALGFLFFAAWVCPKELNP